MSTQAQLAAHLGITQPTVSRLVADAIIPRSAGRGGYDLDACRLAYIHHLREQAAGRRGDDEDLDLATERARLAKAQADAQEMKNRQSERELLPAAEVTAAVQAAFARVRARLLAIPTRAAPVLIGVKSPTEIQAKLTDLVHQALAELAATRVAVEGEE